MKIAVIGAGINGLFLARKLSLRGYEVQVFEKKEKIGKEACSGLFSQRILEFIPESRQLIQNKINSVLIRFPKRALKIKFSKEFVVMNHFELDNLAAELAENSGAKIILNHNVSEAGFNVFQKNFDRIIGCDGPNSIVRKILGLKEPNYRLAIQGFIFKEDYSNFVEAWPVNQGFIWKIPRGKEIEYGIIGESEEIKEIFSDFLKKNNLQLEKIKSAIVPQGFAAAKHSFTALCGDAAGLCKPWSGGGVVWGLKAAEILLKNFPDFLKYQKELKKFFLPKIIFSKIAVKTAYFLGFNVPWLLPKIIKIESDFLVYAKRNKKHS